ncbi:MAG: GNAT family N-acetyltransferase [Clostridia bacterium]|nr:GNAT family N-acetyltransferase [Clostridia bacterium]
MHIRKATLADLDRLMTIYDNARAYMRAHGNASQWGDGYPSPALIAGDIEAGHSFVCEEAGEILGVFCYFEGVDPTYVTIYEGEWLNDAPYGVIHRIAVAAHRRGVASFCYDYCFARCRNLKIDTHRDNIPMQNSLLKNGFQRCGIIYLANGDERIAYQKTGS